VFVGSWGCGGVGVWRCGDVGLWGCGVVRVWGCGGVRARARESEWGSDMKREIQRKARESIREGDEARKGKVYGRTQSARASKCGCEWDSERYTDTHTVSVFMFILVFVYVCVSMCMSASVSVVVSVFTRVYTTSKKKGHARARAFAHAHVHSYTLSLTHMLAPRHLIVWHGVATVSRIDKITGLFCRIQSLL